MVEVRASRLAEEILGDEGVVSGCTRLDVQVAALNDDTSEVRCSRVAVEVLATDLTWPGCTRLDVQVAALNDDSTAEVRCSRLAMEVLASSGAKGAATRLDVQVAALNDDSTAEVRCSRMVVECLARQGSAGPVVPLPLMDDAHVFLHNWATRGEMRSSYRTNIGYSPESGAESRRGLNLKPTRTMKLEWLVYPGSGLDLSDLERLEVFLRRMGNARFQMPIYKDQQELSAAYLSSDDTILLPTRESRFFQGQRVAIVQLDAGFRVSSFSWHLISSMTNASLTFTSTLGVAVPAGSLVFPIIDCEIQLEVEADYHTARVPSVKVTVSEAPGASALPPLKSDLPTGAEIAHDGRPIWYEEPDWAKGIKKGRSRQGHRTRDGRADHINVEGERSRQTHKFSITGTREDMWKALEFFDTRRGRLRSFWHIDQDQYMEAVDLDASGNFIGVSEIGDLTDFSEEFDAVGIVMADGKTYVRSVDNIQQILTVFRITMNTLIDTGLSVNDVYRVARARLTRFNIDEFVENWIHAGAMSTSINMIEVLNEDDYPII